MRITQMYLRRIQFRVAKFFQRRLANAKRPKRIYENECSRFPLLRVEGIQIYGTGLFTDRVSTALQCLERSYPYGYSLVQRYVRSVVESDVKPEFGVAMGVLYERLSP